MLVCSRIYSTEDWASVSVFSTQLFVSFTWELGVAWDGAVPVRSDRQAGSNSARTARVPQRWFITYTQNSNIWSSFLILKQCCKVQCGGCQGMCTCRCRQEPDNAGWFTLYTARSEITVNVEAWVLIFWMGSVLQLETKFWHPQGRSKVTPGKRDLSADPTPPVSVAERPFSFFPKACPWKEAV